MMMWSVQADSLYMLNQLDDKDDEDVLIMIHSYVGTYIV